MFAKVISLFNQAGGVGKTTLTQNLGYQLKEKNYKVLLIDLDPQASLTCFMGIEPYDLETTIYDSLISPIILCNSSKAPSAGSTLDERSLATNK